MKRREICTDLGKNITEAFTIKLSCEKTWKQQGPGKKGVEKTNLEGFSPRSVICIPVSNIFAQQVSLCLFSAKACRRHRVPGCQRTQGWAGIAIQLPHQLSVAGRQRWKPHTGEREKKKKTFCTFLAVNEGFLILHHSLREHRARSPAGSGSTYGEGQSGLALLWLREGREFAASLPQNMPHPFPFFFIFFSPTRKRVKSEETSEEGEIPLKLTGLNSGRESKINQ